MGILSNACRYVWNVGYMCTSNSNSRTRVFEGGQKSANMVDFMPLRCYIKRGIRLMGGEEQNSTSTVLPVRIHPDSLLVKTVIGAVTKFTIQSSSKDRSKRVNEPTFTTFETSTFTQGDYPVLLSAEGRARQLARDGKWNSNFLNSKILEALIDYA